MTIAKIFKLELKVCVHNLQRFAYIIFNCILINIMLYFQKKNSIIFDKDKFWSIHSSVVIFQGHRIYTYGMAAAFLQSAFPPVILDLIKKKLSLPFFQPQFGSLMGVGRVVIGLTSLVNLPLISSLGTTVSFTGAFVGWVSKICKFWSGIS